jgi:hypothetical protein
MTYGGGGMCTFGVEFGVQCRSTRDCGTGAGRRRLRLVVISARCEPSGSERL